MLKWMHLNFPIQVLTLRGRWKKSNVFMDYSGYGETGGRGGSFMPTGLKAATCTYWWINNGMRGSLRGSFIPRNRPFDQTGQGPITLMWKKMEVCGDLPTTSCGLKWLLFCWDPTGKASLEKVPCATDTMLGWCSPSFLPRIWSAEIFTTKKIPGPFTLRREAVSYLETSQEDQQLFYKAQCQISNKF